MKVRLLTGLASNERPMNPGDIIDTDEAESLIAAGFAEPVKETMRKTATRRAPENAKLKTKKEA